MTHIILFYLYFFAQLIVYSSCIEQFSFPLFQKEFMICSNLRLIRVSLILYFETEILVYKLGQREL